MEPKNILMNLRDKRNNNLMNMKQVYNARESKVKKLKMQHLKCMKDHKYVYKFRSKCTYRLQVNKTLQDNFSMTSLMLIESSVL